MELEQERTIGYLCPSCHQPVVETRSLFSLAAAPGEIRCSCGRSKGVVELSERRFRVTVPCLLCGKTHTAEGPIHHFLGKPLAFSCKASGMACCFVGSRKEVEQAMDRLMDAAEKLHPKGEEKGAFLDPLVMEEVLAEIREIAGRDGISCACGSHRWRAEVKYSSIDLICADCGGAVRISAATQDDIDDICCKDRILLKKV